MHRCAPHPTGAGPLRRDGAKRGAVTLRRPDGRCNAAAVEGRTIALDATRGMVFGWLYWKRRIEMAMLGHFATDIVLHFLPPLLSMAPHWIRRPSSSPRSTTMPRATGPDSANPPPPRRHRDTGHGMRDDATAPWQLQPPPASAHAWLLALVVLLPLGITVVALALSLAGPGPKNLIGDSAGLTWAVVVGGTLAVCLLVWALIARGLRRHRIGADDAGLEVATTFYSRRLAWAELDLARARVVDLDEHTEFKPMLKTNGTSLPGLRSGWFRLRNRSKALVATAGGTRVLWLPTQGYDLLLQSRQPQALLQHLRALAPQPGHR